MRKYFTISELQHGLCMFNILTDDEEVAIIISDIETCSAETVLLAIGYSKIEVAL